MRYACRTQERHEEIVGVVSEYENFMAAPLQECSKSAELALCATGTKGIDQAGNTHVKFRI